MFARHAPKSGISYGSPVLEWVEAAHWDNMSYQDFSEMPGEYQSMIIAAHRVTGRASSVKAWAERPRRRGKR